MLLKHSFLYFLARGIPGLVGLATILIFTRIMTPEDYGRYIILISAGMLVSSIAYQWISTSLIRFKLDESFNTDTLLASARDAYILVSIIVAIFIIAPAIYFMPNEWTAYIILALILILVQGMFNISLEYVRSLLSPGMYGSISVLKALMSLGCGALLIYGGYGAIGAILGAIIGFFSANMISYIKLNLFKQEGGSNKNYLIKMFQYGIPLSIGFALSVIISTTDRFMIAILIGESDAGLYAASHGLVQQSIGVLMAMVNLAAYPLILKAYEESDYKQTTKTISELLVLLLLVGSPVLVVFLLFPEFLSNLLLGERFLMDSSRLIPLIAIATIFSSLRVYYSDIPFYLEKKTRYLAYFVLSIAISNILLNYILIPLYGVVGAAYATLLLHCIAFIFGYYLGNRLRRFSIPLLEIGKMTLALCGMIVFLAYAILETTSVNLIILIILSAVIYLFLLYIFNIVNIRQFLNMYLIVKKN